MLLALAVALPFVLLTGGIVWQLANNERETRREAILFSTRTLMNAVDTILSKQIAVAQMLATSPALEADDLATFRQEAARAMSGLSGGWIVLADETGQQLINLAPGATEPLPRRVEAGMKLQRRALETGQIQISGIFNGAYLKSPTVTVELPVRRKDKPPLEIIIAMRPDVFLHAVRAMEPAGRMARRPDRRRRQFHRALAQPRAECRPACIRRLSRRGAPGAAGLERDEIARRRLDGDRPCHLARQRMGDGTGRRQVAVRGADPHHGPGRGPGRRRDDCC